MTKIISLILIAVGLYYIAGLACYSHHPIASNVRHFFNLQQQCSKLNTNF
ncbi:MAG: hypothetical protein GY866_24095 [Proteobacteria bacterium]|nr:hypothetical protein [Pseudomonadota bacterium]